MKDIVVHVPSPYLWDAVIRHEEQVRGKAGLKDNWKDYGIESGILVSTTHTSYSPISYWELNSYEIITVDEYFKRFSKPPEQPIKIGEHEVKDYRDEGFNVGCQFVSWEIYDKIGKGRKV